MRDAALRARRDAFHAVEGEKGAVEASSMPERSARTRMRRAPVPSVPRSSEAHEDDERNCHGSASSERTKSICGPRNLICKAFNDNPRSPREVVFGRTRTTVDGAA